MATTTATNNKIFQAIRELNESLGLRWDDDAALFLDTGEMFNEYGDDQPLMNSAMESSITGQLNDNRNRDDFSNFAEQVEGVNVIFGRKIF